jgi:DNA-binding response OmpR family regulator
MVETEYDARPYEILISDDDAGCRESVRDALSSQGYRTCEATCGEEAIELARHHLVHVMIVDMNMPDLTGLETVTIIRREISMAVPSILMSADSSRDLMARALSARFDSFMPKPLDLRTLRSIVCEILRRYYES